MAVMEVCSWVTVARRTVGWMTATSMLAVQSTRRSLSRLRPTRRRRGPMTHSHPARGDSQARPPWATRRWHGSGGRATGRGQTVRPAALPSGSPAVGRGVATRRQRRSLGRAGKRRRRRPSTTPTRCRAPLGLRMGRATRTAPQGLQIRTSSRWRSRCVRVHVCSLGASEAACVRRPSHAAACRDAAPGTAGVELAT